MILVSKIEHRLSQHTAPLANWWVLIGLAFSLFLPSMAIVYKYLGMEGLLAYLVFQEY
jgi:hypothetical protein